MKMFNCFAYSDEKICHILDVDECMGKKCPFFKTKKQFDEDARKYDYYKVKTTRRISKKVGDVNDR